MNPVGAHVCCGLEDMEVEKPRERCDAGLWIDIAEDCRLRACCGFSMVCMIEKGIKVESGSIIWEDAVCCKVEAESTKCRWKFLLSAPRSLSAKRSLRNDCCTRYWLVCEKKYA